MHNPGVIKCAKINLIHYVLVCELKKCSCIYVTVNLCNQRTWEFPEMFSQCQHSLVHSVHILPQIDQAISLHAKIWLTTLSQPIMRHLKMLSY